MGNCRMWPVLLLVAGCARAGPAAQPATGPTAAGTTATARGSPLTPGQASHHDASLAAPAGEPRSGSGTLAADPTVAPSGNPAQVEPSATPGQAEIDDDELDTPPPEGARAPELPPSIAKLTDEELRTRLRDDPASLGPMSVGWTNAGALVNGVQLPPSTHYLRMDDAHAWATQETIDYLLRAIDKVRQRHPNAPPIYIGHLSGRHGGHLSPHKSHQSGRDVDVSFYYQGSKHRWYRHATPKTLDCETTWTFVRAMLTETDVQMIFINTSVQRLLKSCALRVGEDPDWLDTVFQYKSKHPNPIIRHARGHHTHIHIRFYNPVAQELGRRAYPALVAMGKVKPRQYFVHHRARKGDTLGSLARKYRTTVKAIQRANKLRSTKIFAKKTYRIPREGPVRPTPRPLRLPPRRLPPPGTPRRTPAATAP